MSARSIADQTILVGPDGHVAGLGPAPQKESEMHEAKLGWFDRLLIKIAVAKAAAREGAAFDARLARNLKNAFATIREG